MKQAIYTNKRGESIVLGADAPYILTKIDGTGAAQASLQTQKAPYQDGVTHLDTTLEPRPLTLEIMVLAENAAEMQQRRRRLAQVLNPKLGPGTVRYEYGGKMWEIGAIPELAPAFPDGGDFEDTMQPGLISLLCPLPFWQDTVAESEEMADWIGGLRFGLMLPTMFAGRSTRLNRVLHNAGDVDTPITIEFTGPCLYPKVINADTGEYISVRTELAANEKLIVTTHFGNKTVKLRNIDTGQESNAFHLLDLGSTFFQLAPGDNQLSYDADQGKESATVWIRWRNRYVGV